MLTELMKGSKNGTYNETKDYPTSDAAQDKRAKRCTRNGVSTRLIYAAE